MQLQAYVFYLSHFACQLYLSLLVFISFSELDQLRRQTQTAQTESASAASQTAAMLSLNLKLQSSAMKNLARNIDFELKSLEARESKELLSIVQVCVPSFFFGFELSCILISL